MTAGVFIFLDALVLAATLLPLLPLQHWWSRAGEFPRLQLALAMAAILAMQLLLLPDAFPYWSMHVLVAACLGWQLAWILPYTPLFRREVRPAARPLDASRCLSVISTNVLMSNRNAGKLLAMIRRMDPDIVVLLESNAWWQERMQELRATHPHGLDCALDNRYGMHLYSRLELENPEIRYLVEDGVPSMHTGVRLPAGQCVRLHAVHPSPPSPTENETSRERDAELLVVARAVAEDPCRVIVTGDFNDVAWSPTTRLFRKISRLLDPRIGRGMFNTFHAQLPFLRFPLDHVFHSDDFTLVELEVLPGFGSDHLPIHYRLQYEPAAKDWQSAPQPDANDHAQAGEKIRRTGARKDDVPDPRH